MSMQEKIGRFSYVPSHIAFFRKQGQWFSRGAKTPQKGDVIFFGDEAHVGLVESVTGSTVHTIEGNTKNSAGIGGVLRHSYSLTSAYIMGYGRPDYAPGEAEALVAAARSQVGYLEKRTSGNLDLFTASNDGNGNWTKYGRWYGLNPADWCEMFVSWCAWKADQGSGSEDTPWPEVRLFDKLPAYQNGSTVEKCFADVELDREEQTGSLNTWEECLCLGTVGGRYLVLYPKDGTGDFKVGLVAYHGEVGGQ